MTPVLLTNNSSLHHQHWLLAFWHTCVYRCLCLQVLVSGSVAQVRCIASALHSRDAQAVLHTWQVSLPL